MAGKFVTGTRLPGARALAAAWKTSSFTVHLALRALAKEGWIDRRPSSGTFAADPRHRFLTAAVYYPGNLALDTMSSYTRNLHISLLNRLNRLGKKAQVFIDPRPEEQQGTLLSELEEAIRLRTVQCVIATSLNDYNIPVVSALSVPIATCLSNGVKYDSWQFFHEGLQRMKEAGCRTAALITVDKRPIDRNGQSFAFYDLFRQAAQEIGVVTREEWVRFPARFQPDLEVFGYREFKSIHRLRRKPDCLFVYPDESAKGVAIAALELGVRVPREMKFVFHRNAHGRFLCPFAVTWAISNENDVAHGLVEMLQKQFKGEERTETLIPFMFTDGPGMT